MSAYTSALRARQEDDQAVQDARRKAEATAARERLTPLEDRLAKLLATIPAEVQCEGLSLHALQASLKGRWRGSCHPGELGAALRKLGYRRSRRWYDKEGFRALWRAT